LGATRKEIFEVLLSAYFHTGALTLVHGMVAIIDVLKEMDAERAAGTARPRARRRRS
jgi:alkylhydroperoxidase/carboxymuconolactone decarboxylase family protein YurZ